MEVSPKFLAGFFTILDTVRVNLLRKLSLCLPSAEASPDITSQPILQPTQLFKLSINIPMNRKERTDFKSIKHRTPHQLSQT